jgi:hypothetical protein
MLRKTQFAAPMPAAQAAVASTCINMNEKKNDPASAAMHKCLSLELLSQKPMASTALNVF